MVGSPIQSKLSNKIIILKEKSNTSPNSLNNVKAMRRINTVYINNIKNHKLLKPKQK